MHISNMSFISIIIFIFGMSFLVYLFIKYQKFRKKVSIIKPTNPIHLLILLLSFLVAFVNIFQFKGKEIKKNINTKGVDIMFVLDVSKSMNTADINYGKYKTTRLETAKKAIENYISKHKENRYGLVIFAGDAIASIPLTSDKDIFLTLLAGLDYRNLTKQGTNFQKALSLAVSRFKKENKGKVLVFISDGGDDGDYKGLNFNFPKDIKTIIIGVGTKNGGKIVLGQNAFGEYNYQTYNGQYVITKLNEQNLKKLADDINGKYIQLDNIGKIYQIDKYIQNIEKQAITIKSDKERQDLTRYFIMLSFMLFLIYLLLNFISYKK